LKTENADLSKLSISREKRDEPPAPSRFKGVGVTIIILAALAIAGYLGAGWLKSFLTKPVKVEFATVSLRSPSEEISILTASGYVVAQRKAAVASKATGMLVALNVKEGDPVKSNQVIAKLEDGDIRAMLAEAEAALALAEADLPEAKRNLERQRKLAAETSMAEVELERAETMLNRVVASIAMAKARVEGAKVALENTVIRAPFDGTVLTKNADVGEMVAPMAAGISARAAVVTIADLGSLEVEVDVSESNIQKIGLGTRAEIRLDAYPTLAYPGSVASVIPTADRGKGTVMVKIAFDEYDSRVLPEMSAKVTFLKEKDQAAARLPAVLTLPESAVAERNGKTIAYRVAGDRAEAIEVQTGARFNGLLEIRNGLREGERVIRSVKDDVEDGVKVEG